MSKEFYDFLRNPPPPPPPPQQTVIPEQILAPPPPPPPPAIQPPPPDGPVVHVTAPGFSPAKEFVLCHGVEGPQQQQQQQQQLLQYQEHHPQEEQAPVGERPEGCLFWNGVHPAAVAAPEGGAEKKRECFHGEKERRCGESSLQSPEKKKKASLPSPKFLRAIGASAAQLTSISSVKLKFAYTYYIFRRCCGSVSRGS